MTEERSTKVGSTERAHHAGDVEPAAPRQRRMSAQRKQEAVLRVLRGEDLELVSLEMGVTGAALNGWRDSFLAAEAASLKSRTEDDRDRELRVMREHRLLAHQLPGAPHGPRAHDGTITTEQVDEMWATDLTTVATGEGLTAVFVAIDHCSAECVGIHASPRTTRHEALEPIRPAVRGSFGALGKDVVKGLSNRQHHSNQYMTTDFQREIRFLGARSSPAFVRAPEGNGCAEQFIRTPKENLLWVRCFETIEDLRQAILEFQRTYNQHWLIKRHGHRPPAAIRREQTVNMQKAA